MDYDSKKAIIYAHNWSHSRNPEYYDFDTLGGDCTNFISQCLYAGCGVMNYTRDTGWYYRSLNDRAAAWSSVEHLYRFLIANQGDGPYASEIPLSYAQPGDIIQLSFDGKTYAHSLLVVRVSMFNILVAAHTVDSDNRALSSYSYKLCRLLRIDGVRQKT